MRKTTKNYYLPVTTSFEFLTKPDMLKSFNVSWVQLKTQFLKALFQSFNKFTMFIVLLNTICN